MQTGVDFINNLCVRFSCFSYEIALSSFSLVTFWLCDFFANGNQQKSERKMLMKLTLGVIFNKKISLIEKLPALKKKSLFNFTKN